VCAAALPWTEEGSPLLLHGAEVDHSRLDVFGALLAMSAFHH